VTGYYFRDLVLLLIAWLLSAQVAVARVQYVDPSINPAAYSDGSEQAPWRNLQALIDNNGVKSGDRIVLKSGYYGSLSIRNKDLSLATTLKVGKGQTAQFSRVKISNSQNWVLQGLTVSASFDLKTKPRYMIDIAQRTSKITVEDFEIYTIEDSKIWTNVDWDKKAVSGIFIRGDDITVRNNRLRNVNYGISSMGQRSIVSGNVIDQFSGDGLRGLGDYSVFEGNIVKNCYAVNKNHDDGFQSWSTGIDSKVGTGAVTGVVLRRNLFIANDDPQKDGNCQMQGIGLFDGMYVDWVIENNIVIVDHWHGITVMGAKNVRIINNTVWDPNNKKPGPAWIRVWKHKNGTDPQGNLVANNLASAFKNSKIGVLQLQNQLIRNPYALFVDPDNFDFRLKKGARAINQGMDGLRVTEDFFGTPRPQGGRIDVGASEYRK